MVFVFNADYAFQPNVIRRQFTKLRRDLDNHLVAGSYGLLNVVDAPQGHGWPQPRERFFVSARPCFAAGP